MSVAPLFPENPEKIVVPTGVSWKYKIEKVSIFVYKLMLHDVKYLNTFTVFTTDIKQLQSYIVVSYFLFLLAVWDKDEEGTH